MDTSGVGNPLRRPILKNRLGAAHIVKVRVQHGHDWPIGDLAQFGDGLAHLLGRLARINGDDAIGTFHKRLIRQSVSDQCPHTLTNFIKMTSQNLGLLGMFYVGHLPTWKGDRLRIVGGKRSLMIPALSLCHLRTIDGAHIVSGPQETGTKISQLFPVFGFF